MKQQIKNGIIFGLTASITMMLAGVVYAAWDDVVSSGDPLTSASWNEVVERVKAFDVSSGNIGIGTSSPENAIHISRASTQAGIFQENTDGTQGGQYPSITQYAYNSGHAAIVGGRATGTKASPGVAPANVTLQTMVGRGYDGTDFQEVGRVSVLSGEDFSASELDGKIIFQVRDNNVANTAMTIIENGNVGIGTQDPGFLFHSYHSTTNSVAAFESGDTSVNIRFDDSDTTNTVLFGAVGNSAYIGHISGGNKLLVDDTGDVTITDLIGSYTGGSAYLCINDSGVVFASETACP